MRRVLATALLATTFAGLALAWSPDRWAVAVAQAGVLAVAAVWACGLMSGRAALPAAAPLVLPAGLLCCGAAQLAFGWTVYRWQTTETMLYWLANLAAVVVASGMAEDRSLGRFLLDWLFRCGVALVAISVVQGYTSDGYAFWLFRTPYRDEVWGPFLYHNQFAAFIELLLPLACVRALSGEGPRWAYVLATSGLYAAVVASASRMGLAIATAELVVVGAILLARRQIPAARLAVSFAPLLVVAALFIGVVGPEKVWQRLQEHDPYSQRRDMTLASLVMFRDRPATGFGLGTWPTVYPGYAGEDDGRFANQAHNDWAQAAVEGGAPGLLCLVLFFAWTLKTGWREPWTLGLAFVLLHAFVDYPIQRQSLGVFYFIAAGLASRWDAARTTYIGYPLI